MMIEWNDVYILQSVDFCLEIVHLHHSILLEFEPGREIKTVITQAAISFTITLPVEIEQYGTGITTPTFQIGHGPARTQVDPRLTEGGLNCFVSSSRTTSQDSILTAINF